jgi:peptidyl-prolyl cis-trans isomerase SurA
MALLAVAIAVAGLVGRLPAQPPAAAAPAGANEGGSKSGVAPETVVARVDGRPILASDVARLMRGAFGGTSMNAATQVVLQAQALDELVQQRLVAMYLAENGVRPTAEELDAASQAALTQAKAQGKTLSAFLAERGQTLNTLREGAAWDACWSRFAREQLTDQHLEEFFAAHRREYDGTQVHVSHILLRPTGSGNNPAAINALVERARRIREEIVTGKLTFAEAARRDSDGPSREQGGDLGYLPRHNRMVEAFSAATFALDPQQISEPVITSFGVHLILCTGIKPGTKTWREVRGDLTTPATNDLFHRLAAELRPKAKVEYTGAIPYLEPGTQRVVMPRPRS